MNNRKGRKISATRVRWGQMYSKVGCVFSMVIWSEFCMGQYKDNHHREDAPHLIVLKTDLSKSFTNKASAHQKGKNTQNWNSSFHTFLRLSIFLNIYQFLTWNNKGSYSKLIILWQGTHSKKITLTGPDVWSLTIPTRAFLGLNIVSGQDQTFNRQALFKNRLFWLLLTLIGEFPESKRFGYEPISAFKP